MALTRDARRALAQETVEALAVGVFKGLDFRAEMAAAIAASTFVPAGGAEDAAASGGEAGGETEVLVVPATTTLQACRKEWEAGARRIGALNFASARNPGGGFLSGAQAQEESLARASALYPCLTKFTSEMYIPNRNARSGVYTHDMIVSPAVPVFRTDDGSPVGPYPVTFVSAPAPNNGVVKRQLSASETRSLVSEQLQARIRRVLALFRQDGADTVVLGAYGCGVFQNDPATVARIFRAELLRTPFRRAIFPIPDPAMYATFASVLLESPGRPPASSSKPRKRRVQ